MKSRHLTIMLVISASAFGVWALGGEDPRSTLGDLDASRSPPTPTGEGRGEVPPASGRALPRTAVASIPAAAPTTNEAEADPLQTASEASAQRAMDPEEVRVRIDEIFQEESTDPAWGTQARATAHARIAEILPGSSRLRSIECHASMCRFETAHQDPESYRQFLISAFHDPATKLWEGGGFSTPLPGHDEDGRVVTVAYLARDGQPLPPVWQPR